MTTFSNINTASSNSLDLNQDCAPLSASKTRVTPELIEIVFLDDSEDSDEEASECSQSPTTPERLSEI